MRIKNVFLFLFISSVSVNAFAWGPTGHRVVAQVADAYLTPKARLAVKKILGTESMAMASNWPDFIKSDSTMNYLSAWHYINVKPGMNYADFKTHLKEDTLTDAYTKLNFLIKELKKKNLGADKKKMYLRLLIHIVGDIHQPMHVSHAEDMGGNKIKVMWFNEPANLHSVWDDKLVEFQKLSYTEYTASINHTTASTRRAWQTQPVTEWFYESYQLADKIYSGITQPDQRLSYRYNFEYVDILNQQLLKGGVRLAGLLNELFK